MQRTTNIYGVYKNQFKENMGIECLKKIGKNFIRARGAASGEQRDVLYY